MRTWFCILLALLIATPVLAQTVEKDAEDQTFYFVLVDATDGTPETGLTITDLDMTYTRFGATAVKADATELAAVNSVHGASQMKEVDGTNQPGLYRADWPDAAFATAVDGVILTINGTEISPVHLYVQLVSYDPDAVSVLTTSDNIGINWGDVSNPTTTVALTGTTVDLVANAVDAAAVKADAVTEVQSGLATGTKQDTAQTDLDALTGADGATLATAQGNYAPAKAGALMGLAADAITSAKYDESTAFPVKSADTGSTQIARTGADSDTLEDLSDEIATRSTLGDGAITHTYTLTNSVTGLPIVRAAVRATTDVTGANTVAAGYTNSSGQAVFHLDADTYYLWRTHADYTFTNPDTEVVE